MTDKEYEKLKKDFENYSELIDFLDEYIEEKSYHTKNCYVTINRWVKNAVEERKRKDKPSPSLQKESIKKGPLNNFKGPEIDFENITDMLKLKQLM